MAKRKRKPTVLTAKQRAQQQLIYQSMVPVVPVRPRAASSIPASVQSYRSGRWFIRDGTSFGKPPVQ
jgi:hypothetical protein